MHNGARRLASLGLSALFLLGLAAAAFASTAVPQWQQIFHPAANGTTSAAPIAARELADGTVLVVTQDLQTVHYNHDGTIVSLKQLRLTPARGRASANRRGPAGLPDAGPGGVVNTHAAIDGFGRVVLSTVAPSGNIPRDSGIAETMKFDGLTGDPLWPGPVYYNSHVAETPLAVFLDPSGDVVLTTGAHGNERHTTLKYAARDGSILWGPQIIESVSFPSAQTTASMDTAGDVYVSVPIGFPEVGIATYKYRGADGVILWGPVLYADSSALPGASVVDPDGNYVVAAGSGPVFLALKYDGSSGALLWGPTLLALPSGSTDVFAQSVVADASGGVFVSGRYDSPGTGPELISFKLARATGAMLWAAPPIDTHSGSQAVQSVVASNGDLILGGVLGTSADPQVNFWRYRGADGAPAWSWIFGPISGFDPPAFFLGSNGRIFTTELVHQGYPDAALNSGEIDAQTGVPAWGPTPADFPHVDVTYFTSLAAGPDGNPVVAGLSSGSTHQIETLKYDRSTGAVVWGPVIFDPADTYVNPWQVAVDGNNDVFLLGFHQSLIDTSQYATFLIKYSGSTGGVLWGPTLLPNLAPQAIALDAAGDALLLNWSQDPTSFATHAATAKVSGANGSVLWGPIPYVGDPMGNDYADFLSLDASGNAFVVGEAIGGGGDDWFVLKYGAADGSVLFGPVFPSPGQPKGAAVDSSGNLAVSGNDDLFTMTTFRFSGSSGAALWGPITLASASAGTVAVATNGDVVATGVIFQSGSNIDFVTTRYKSSDGSVVWGPAETDGAGHGLDEPFGLAFDASGNVVLGGSSQAINLNLDISLVKYDGATGIALWGPVYVGGPNDERLAGLNVQGNSIVVGATSEAGLLTAMLDESLGIQTSGPALPPAFCGEPYDVPFVAQNGSPSYTWSIVAGNLPDGLTLSPGGSLSGTPTEQGSFTFTVRVTDSTLAQRERAFALVVTEDPGDVAILALPAPSCHYTLAVPPGFASYLWLPGGETTPTIDVAPVQRTTYGVIVGDGSGCFLHLSVTLGGTALQDPSCIAPSIQSISPTSGPGAGGTPVTILGAKFEPGAEVVFAGQDVPGTVVDPAHITTTSPAIPPGLLGSLLVRNPDTGTAFLATAFFADFLDVPPDNVFHDSVERLVRGGVTVGCGNGNFCVDQDTTRAQMAVFLLRSLLGPTYTPPLPTGGVFEDVPFDAFAAAWIEDLYARGITGGCLTDPLRYCPDANVSRAEMAVFLLKTLLGKDYVPPAATGTVFADVPADAFAAAWIEDLYNRGLTAGCLVSPLRFCPDRPVTRGEMAAFLVNTFGL